MSAAAGVTGTDDSGPSTASAKTSAMSRTCSFVCGKAVAQHDQAERARDGDGVGAGGDDLAHAALTDALGRHSRTTSGRRRRSRTFAGDFAAARRSASGSCHQLPRPTRPAAPR